MTDRIEPLNWLKKNVFVNEIEKDRKWVVDTPFLDRHNDYTELYVVRKSDDTFILTDDGFVYSDLVSSGAEPLSPKRKELFVININGFGVKFNDKTKEIYIETDLGEIGKSKHKLVQAMLAIGDMFMLASHNISSIFREDVISYFRRRNIPFNYDFKVQGRSFIEHNIEIALPVVGSNPETFIKVINNPIIAHAKNVIFAFMDIKEIRKEIRSVVVYNDSEQKPAKGFIQALTQYKIECIAWSEREKYSEKILKNYEKIK